MSSFVTSDYNVLAIVRGLRLRKMIGYRDRGIVADAIRKVNEVITWEEWRKKGSLPFDLPSDEELEKAIGEEELKANGLKPWQVRELAWEVAVDANHVKVKWVRDREFTDEEIWQACKCWLRQVNIGSSVLERPFEEVDEDGNVVNEHFDYVTIIAAVKKLKRDIESEHVRDKSWKRKCFFGNWKFYFKNGDDEWVDIEKTVSEDLAA